MIVLLAILLVALVAGAAYLLPKMFESPPDDVQVPDLVGLTEDEARAAIGDAELAVGDRTFETSDSVERNRVISQDPNPDQFVAPGTEIDFVVSEGKPQVEVPFVVGQKRDAARDALDERGLEAKFQERDSDEPAGQVLETDPAGGAMVREGAVVTVIYSDGPEKIPDVVGHAAGGGREDAARGRVRPRRGRVRRHHEAEGDGHPAEPAVRPGGRPRAPR